MKALTIPASRPSMRERMRSISATVSNHVQRKTYDARRSLLATAITATMVFFACLGLMYVPGIIASGLTALTCAAIAPMDDKEGGAA